MWQKKNVVKPVSDHGQLVSLQSEEKQSLLEMISETCCS